MFYDNKGKKEQNADSALLSGLTRRQLKELEEKEKTPAQKLREAVIMLLPLLCGCSDGLDLSLMIISMGVDVTEIIEEED